MMMDWQFRLLGKPEVWYGKDQIEVFNTQKTQALLLYLIAERCTQNRNELARFFWDDFNLISSQNNLRTALYHLKKDFGDYLEVDRQSVCFRLPQSAYLDLAVIDSINQDADLQALSAAADAYRGDFLGGFSTTSPQFEAWKEIKQAHYRQITINHLLRLAGLYEKNQQLKRGLQVTQQILEIQPFNEAAVLLRMRFFAGLGQLELAIQEYHHYQDYIHKHPDAHASLLITSAYDDLKENVSRQPTTKLPHALTTFFGREDEAAQLTSQLVDPSLRLINLVGPSGIGKTRLGIRAAEMVSSHFLDGVYYIDVGGVDASQDHVSAENLSKLLLYILGRKIILDKSYAAQLADTLSDMHTLILFDNYEPSSWRETFFTELVQTIPNIKLFVISRERVNLPGAASTVLNGLGYPTDNDLFAEYDPSVIHKFPSLQLFEERAQRVQPDFRIDQSNFQQVAYICRAVQGLPFGIEYIASLLRSTSLNMIMNAILGDASQVPATFTRIPDELKTVFDYIWANMPRKTQEIALACTLFKGSFTMEDFAAVTHDPPDWLPALVEASLLYISAEGNFSLHGLVQIFLQNERAQLPECYPARFSTHYLKWLIRIDNEAETGPYPLEKIRDKNANLVNAWQLAQELGQYRLLLQACEPFSRAFQELGMDEIAYKHLKKTADWLAKIFEESYLPKRAFCSISLELGRFEERSGNLPSAFALTEDALNIAQSLEDPALLAQALQSKASLSIHTGDVQPAIKLAYDGLTHAVKSGNERLVAAGVIGLSQAYCKNHQYQKARKLFKTAFEEHLVRDNSRLMQKLLIELSSCEKDQGNFRLSLGIGQKAQRLNQSFLDVIDEANLAFLRGENYKFLGQFSAARDAFTQALGVFSDNNHHEWQVRTLGSLSLLNFWQAEYQAAIELLESADAIAREHKLRLLPEILVVKARVLLAGRQIEEASACLQEASTYTDAQSQPFEHACYISAVNIDLALANQEDDTARHLAIRMLPKVKFLYFDSIDDPFSVYLSAYLALKNTSNPSSMYVLAHAQREFSRLTNHLKSAEAKAAFLSIPHRAELMEIIHNHGNQPA